MKQAHVFISGNVQKVGYRFFVRDNVGKLDIKGWVRNTEDGGVEAIFQGTEEAIEKIIALCKEGSMLAEVKQIGMEWEEAEEEFKDFQIT